VLRSLSAYAQRSGLRAKEAHTAYVDAVATLPCHQGRRIGGGVMSHLATIVTD
jgi:ribosomal protein S18 acetylase RimI-like enzyme